MELAQIGSDELEKMLRTKREEIKVYCTERDRLQASLNSLRAGGRFSGVDTATWTNAVVVPGPATPQALPESSPPPAETAAPSLPPAAAAPNWRTKATAVAADLCNPLEPNTGWPQAGYQTPDTLPGWSTLGTSNMHPPVRDLRLTGLRSAGLRPQPRPWSRWTIQPEGGSRGGESRGASQLLPCPRPAPHAPAANMQYAAAANTQHSPAAGTQSSSAANTQYAHAANTLYAAAADTQHSPAAGTQFSSAANTQYAPAANTQYAPAANTQYAPADGMQYAPADGTQYAPACSGERRQSVGSLLRSKISRQTRELIVAGIKSSGSTNKIDTMHDVIRARRLISSGNG